MIEALSWCGIIPLREEEYKELVEKAEKWEQYAIYDNEKEAEIPVKDLIVAYEKLETIKKLVEEGPHPDANTLEDWQQAVDDWLGKLMNILEAES